MIIQHTFTQRNRAAKRAPEMGGMLDKRKKDSKKRKKEGNQDSGEFIK